MKIIIIATVFLTAANFTGAQTPGTNAVPRTPREGDIVPAPGPRDRAYGISGPGAKHTAAWTNYNRQATGSAVTNGLIPNLKPLIADTQLRDTIVILGGDGNYYLTGSSGADIWDFNDGIELWRSADLKKWDYDGEVWTFDKNGTWGKTGSGIASPCARSGRRKSITSGGSTIISSPFPCRRAIAAF